MKTNYKKIYKALEKRKIFDEIINENAGDGVTGYEIMNYIIYGIESAVEFFNSETFKEMKYRPEKQEELKNQIAQKIAMEYAKVLLEKNEKERQQIQYLWRHLI